MKIKPEDYATLEKALKEVVARNPDLERRYGKAGFSHTRYRWDMLNGAVIDGKASTYFICDVLYKYINDSHIDTALKKILPPADFWGVT